MKKIILSFLGATAIVYSFMSMNPAHADVEGAGVFDKERFQLRARLIGVLADGDGFVTEAPTLGTDVDNAITPEFDVTYFFTDHFAAELIAATAKHSIDAGTNDIGDTWILPPTLTLQYHFMPDDKFSPYVGAGINYSYFYGEDSGSGFNDLEVDGGFGYAVQGGFDYWLNDNWGINFDAKYIALEVDVSVNNNSLNAKDADLNPFIIGGGISYRF